MKLTHSKSIFLPFATIPDILAHFTVINDALNQFLPHELFLIQFPDKPSVWKRRSAVPSARTKILQCRQVPQLFLLQVLQQQSTTALETSITAGKCTCSLSLCRGISSSPAPSRQSSDS